MLTSKLEQNCQTQLIKSSLGLGLSGHLMYKSYLTIYSTQSTILSYSEVLRSGIHLFRTPMHIHSIKRPGKRRIEKRRDDRKL
jgi:hypothetical protein